MYHSDTLEPQLEHYDFLWRGMNRDLEQYVLARVTFDDRLSGSIAKKALHCTTEMYKEIHSSLMKDIMQNTYLISK